MIFYSIKFALKYEHVSAVECTPDGPSGGTPTFEFEIKGALEVTIDLHFKMHMIVHFLGSYSGKNDLIKR